MTKVSRWKVEPEKLAIFRDDFWSAITLLEDKKEVAAFLKEFLTPTERVMFAKRFQVALMLIAGFDYQSIKNRVHVTDPTIAKVANLISEKGSAIIELAQRIMNLKEKKQDFQSASRPFRVRGDLLTPLAEVASIKVGAALARRKRKDSAKNKLR